jgi:nucleotide-binding universal stress UspA family protein
VGCRADEHFHWAAGVSSLVHRPNPKEAVPLIFVGHDRSEDHHDVVMLDAEGARLAAGRLEEGVGGVARFLLGRVPSKVVHHAPCNVLIVRTT